MTPQLKAKVEKSATKVMAITFFDHRGMAYCHFVHPGHTVKAYYYKGVLKKLIRVHIPHKHPKFQGGRFKLHHDNVLAHTAEILRALLETKKVEVMPHLAYSSDGDPNGFFLYPMLKTSLKGWIFSSIKGI